LPLPPIAPYTAPVSVMPTAAADAQRAPPGLVGLLLIAPGVDASELRWAALTAEQHAAVQAGGAAPLDSPYIAGGGGGLSKAFFERGIRNILFEARP
jgi:hypothetical protein